MLPDLAEHTVDRDTWQGMASARVPSAYPVPRVRLPRMLGGLRGILPPALPPTGPVGTTSALAQSTIDSTGAQIAAAAG